MTPRGTRKRAESYFRRTGLLPKDVARRIFAEIKAARERKTRRQTNA